MSGKKISADSAENGVARNRNHGSKCCGDPGNLIAELIEQIEVMLTADDFACAFQEWVDPAWADIAIANPATASMARCHASISYIRGHQAWNIDLFWNSASRAMHDHASETVRKWRPEAIKI